MPEISINSADSQYKLELNEINELFERYSLLSLLPPYDVFQRFTTKMERDPIASLLDIHLTQCQEAIFLSDDEARFDFNLEGDSQTLSKFIMYYRQGVMDYKKIFMPSEFDVQNQNLDLKNLNFLSALFTSINQLFLALARFAAALKVLDELNFAVVSQIKAATRALPNIISLIEDLTCQEEKEGLLAIILPISEIDILPGILSLSSSDKYERIIGFFGRVVQEEVEKMMDEHLNVFNSKAISDIFDKDVRDDKNTEIQRQHQITEANYQAALRKALEEEEQKKTKAQSTVPQTSSQGSDQPGYQPPRPGF